jgi:ATP synthase protein I
MAEDEPWQDPKPPQDVRLASLDERLAKAQAAEAERIGRQTKGPRSRSDDGEGMRVLTVLLSYPLGSALIGWVIDRFVGTHWVWIVLLFVGFGSAIWEVWKIAQRPTGGQDK